MTIVPTTCRFHRTPGLVTMRLDGVTVLLTDDVAGALWLALGAAIEAEPMADDDPPATHGDPMMRVRRTDPAAILPAYATEGASGLDLHALADVVVGPVWERIPTGIALEIPAGYEGQIRPRSSATLAGLDVALGTVDADYRGPVSILARCIHGAKVIQAGDRIAQLVIAPVARVLPVEVDELSETERGSGGFGSTGQGAALAACWPNDTARGGQVRVGPPVGSCGHPDARGVKRG